MTSLLLNAMDTAGADYHFMSGYKCYEEGTLNNEIMEIMNKHELVGRIIESTLYDITNDFSHQYMKIFFQVKEIDGKTARTIFKGHEYSRDYLRSLVRRRTTKVGHYGCGFSFRCTGGR
jgi:ribosomal protein S3AE